MFDRFHLGALGLICLTLAFTGCGSSSGVDSITVTPSTVSFGGVGLTAQLTATGTVGHGSHPSTTEDVTSQVTWTSSSADVATVSSTGLVTSVGPGSIQITASLNGFTGVLTSSTTVTVTIATTGGGGTNTDVIAVSIIPGNQSVASPNQTGQFIAIGTTAAGATENLTDQVLWSSSSTSVAKITNTGLVTGLSQGTSTITAIATNADKTVATGTATFTVAGGASEPFTALSVIPSSQSLLETGQTGNFVAIGTSGSTGLMQDVTNSPILKWTSSIQTVATVTSGLATGNGVAQGVSPGTATITAELTNPDGTVLTSTAAVTVLTTTTPPEPLLSLTIIPPAIIVGNLQGTGNFLAIGTFSTVPYVRDLTNTVTWLSSEPNVFPVSTNSTPPNPGAPGGIVTAYGNGSNIAIIAEATSTDGTIQTATAEFSCPLILPNPNGNPPTPGSCYPGSQANGLLVTLTVYNEGLNTTNWLVTAPSATNTPNVIHCGPGWAADGNTTGSVCTATYPIGTTITLLAPAQTGVAFGGWSYNCTPTAAINANGPNSCQITLGAGANSNVTVGAIFN